MSKVEFGALFLEPLRNGVTKPKRVRGSGYKMVNMGEIFSLSFIQNQTMDRVPLTDKEKAATLLQNNDLLFARQSLVRDGAGKCSIFLNDNEPVCFESHIIRVRLNQELCYPMFYYYFFSSRLGKNTMDKIIEQGAGAAGIRGSDLAKLEVPYIEYSKQKEIADSLYSFDQKIQLNTQINQTLEQISQALFKSWFVDFDPVRAKVQALSDGLSLEQSELAAMQAISGKTPEELTALSQTQPERYAELAETAKAFPCEMVGVDGVEVPKEWEVKRIDEVIQKIPVGKKYSSKTAFSEGLVPILDQGRSGVIGYHNDKPGVKASIEDPIIVFANHTCYMRLISYDFSAIQNVFAFKGKECNLYWLYLATLGKQEFVEYKGHFPDFLIKEIIVPPEELTELFGKYVKESFSKIFINDRENSNLAKIRDLLLPKLLNGGIQNE